MRTFGVALALVCFASEGAVAQTTPGGALNGGVSAGTAATSTTATATTTPASPATATSAANTGTGPGSLQPPPPASVTMPPAAQGVPPTPAPAFPGLPSAPQSPSTPNTTGFSTQITAELRRSPELSAPATVGQVQVLLSSGGFYRGPIDGLLSAPTRSSIRAFQESVRLPATGQLDPETLAALGVSASAPVTVPGTGLAGAAGGGATPTQGATASTSVPSTTATVPAASAAAIAPGIVGTPTAGGAVTGTPVAGRSPAGASDSSREPFPLSVPGPTPPYPSSPIFVQP